MMQGDDREREAAVVAPAGRAHAFVLATEVA